MDLSHLPWKDIVTIVAAGLGAGLGVMNTWQSINQRRVRLRVKPAHAISATTQRDMFSIEVVNLSTFSVTVHEVGFALGGRKVGRRPRAAMPVPIVTDGKPWPRRLKPRETVSAYFDPSECFKHGEPLGLAYAKTVCGEIAHGDSPARQQLAEAVERTIRSRIW